MMSADDGKVYARKVRAVAEIMGDMLGGEEDWLRADVLEALAKWVNAHDTAQAQADDLIEQGCHWETFSDEEGTF